MEEFDDELLEKWSKVMADRMSVVEKVVEKSGVDDKEKAKNEMFHWVITPIKYFSDDQNKSKRGKSVGGNNGEDITDKQKSYIISMMEGDAGAIDVTNSWLKENAETKAKTENAIADLNKTQASNLIEKLRNYHGHED